MSSVEFDSEERLDRERAFHDRLADSLEPEAMPPAPLNRLDRAMVDMAGELKDRRALDLGCGSGDLSVLLALAGANVVGVDLSSGMVGVTRRRVETFIPDADARFVAAPARNSP